MKANEFWIETSQLSVHWLCCCTQELIDLYVIIMCSGSAQTLGAGWNKAGGHHGHTEKGGRRHLWRQACWRGWQSRLQVCSVHVLCKHWILACELWQQVLFIFFCNIELSRSLQNTWKKRPRPAVSLPRRKVFWNRDSTYLYLLSDNSFLTSSGKYILPSLLPFKPDISIFLKKSTMSFLSCHLQGQQHSDRCWRDRQREDHPADTVSTRRWLHQLWHGGLYSAPKSSSHERGEESQWRDRHQPWRWGEIIELLEKWSGSTKRKTLQWKALKHLYHSDTI